MAITEITEYASSGAKIPPSAEEQTNGLAGGAQPTAQGWNYLWNAAHKKINEIIRGGFNGYSPFTTNFYISSRYTPAGMAWGHPRDTLNTLHVGDNPYWDMRVYYTSDNRPRLMLLRCESSSARNIDIVDPEYKVVESTSPSLGDAITWSSASPTVTAIAFCTDGTSVYVVFKGDWGGSPASEYRVQAYDIDGWTVKSGWPVNGCLLPGTGDPSRTYGEGVRNCVIQVVSATQIATLNAWVDISSSASTAVSVVGMDDGIIDGSGAGDSPTTQTPVACNGLCSDGTNIYFAVYRTDNSSAICSATLADLTSGCGNTGWPHAPTGSCQPRDMIFTGHHIITGYTSTSARCLHINTSENGNGFYYTPVNTDAGDITGIMRLEFDGLNLWGLARVRGDGSGEYYPAFIRINYEWGTQDDAATANNIGSLYKFQFGVWALDSYEVLSSSYFTAAWGPIVFDGRDMWGVYGIYSGHPGYGYLHRLPHATVR